MQAALDTAHRTWVDHTGRAWLRVGEVARMLGVTRARVYQLSPVLHPVRNTTRGGRTRHLYTRETIESYLGERARLAAAVANLKASR